MKIGAIKLQILRNLDVDESGDAGVARACQLFGGIIINQHATDTRYVKLYDKATAPTVGTDTPKITIPAKAGVPVPFEIVKGVDFTAGIGLGATTAIADADTGAPATNDVIVHLFYK